MAGAPPADHPTQSLDLTPAIFGAADALEAHGRPGDVARSILGRFAVDQGRGVSADVAEAWQSLSAIVQAESAALELRSCGFGPADWGTAGYYM